MTNEKDKMLAKKIVGTEGRAVYNFYALMDRIESALATVRAEEREAAFKILCPECAGGIKSVFDESARWYYHGEGRVTVGCSASKLRIALEAATENRKGEG